MIRDRHHEHDRRPSTESEVKRRVAYFYDSEIGNFHYGQGHPMKPHRVRMTHNLVVNYGLYRQMEVFRPKPVSAALMTRFHSDDYINFLRIITPDNMHEYLRQLQHVRAPKSISSAAKLKSAALCARPRLPQSMSARIVRSSMVCSSFASSTPAVRSVRSCSAARAGTISCEQDATQSQVARCVSISSFQTL